MAKKKKVDTTKVEEKEEDFLSGNAKLSNENRLEVLVSHLECDNIQKQIQAAHTKSELLEREKIICNLRISDLKAQVVRKQRDHKDLIDRIGQKMGINLRDSVINQETGEVNFS